MPNTNKHLFIKLLNLSREEWPILIKGMIFLLISSAALMVYPQYIKVIIDEAMKSKDMNGLNMAALIAVGVFMIQAVTSSLRFYYFTLAGEKTVKRLRIKLFSQIISHYIYKTDNIYSHCYPTDSAFSCSIWKKSEGRIKSYSRRTGHIFISR